MPVNLDEEELPTQLLAETTIAALHQIIKNSDAIDKLCTPCIGSKLTRVVRCNKSMTVITNKLKEIHVDLWGPHDPPSQLKSTYKAILMCEHTRKAWTPYLKGKDDFVDTCQTWLPRVEAKSDCFMKMLQADSGRGFISSKLQSFCEKWGIAIKYAASYVHEENGLAERGLRIIITIKDLILIDSDLPNNF